VTYRARCTARRRRTGPRAFRRRFDASLAAHRAEGERRATRGVSVPVGAVIETRRFNPDGGGSVTVTYRSTSGELLAYRHEEAAEGHFYAECRACRGPFLVRRAPFRLTADEPDVSAPYVHDRCPARD